MDISKHPLLRKCYELRLALEACGASAEQTRVSTLADEVMEAVDKLLSVPISGYAVHTHAELHSAALYPLSQEAEAQDAARRWKACITALAVHPMVPVVMPNVPLNGARAEP